MADLEDILQQPDEIDDEEELPAMLDPPVPVMDRVGRYSNSYHGPILRQLRRTEIFDAYPLPFRIVEGFTYQSLWNGAMLHFILRPVMNSVKRSIEVSVYLPCCNGVTGPFVGTFIGERKFKLDSSHIESLRAGRGYIDDRGSILEIRKNYKEELCYVRCRIRGLMFYYIVHKMDLWTEFRGVLKHDELTRNQCTAIKWQ